MAKAKKTDFKGKTKVELNAAVLEMREKIWHSKLDLMAGKTKNIKEIRAMKKDVARALTALKAAA
jgi:ribosomal protein L29